MPIHNPALFIGEAVSGSTVGAPLSSDTSGNLTSGISHTEVSATGSISASTGADALVTGMTITPVSGSYMVWFSADVNSTAAGAIVSLAIYVGGVQKADSQRKIMPFAGGALTAGDQRIGIVTQGLVTVNGSQAIEIKWSTSSSAPTMAGRTMNILRVA